LHLSPDDIAAAEACGVSFLPASDAQVQRLAMQRKVFYQAGAPILATRGDGFFETVGTLQQLIEEGRAQQRDLAQWLQAAATAAAGEAAALAAASAVREVVPTPEPEPMPEAAGPASPMAAADGVAEPEPAEATPKRPRQKRRRPAVVPWVDPATAVAAPEAVPEIEPVLPKPLLAASLDVEAAEAPAPLAARAERAALSVEERGKRWLMAGAARRGRAGKHWSTRQR
jgi:hypothetical protein